MKEQLPQRRRNPLRFAFILTEDFSLLAFSCFIEALRELEDHGHMTGRRFCCWEVIGSAGASFRSSCGVKVGASHDTRDADSFDHVVVVGGRWEAKTSSAAVGFLARAAFLAKTIVAIDTGTFVVARAGLMADRRFCLHWFHYREFADEFPQITASMDQIFIVDGNFVSCAGGTWSSDLASHLIAEIWGGEEASRAISLMGLERMRHASHYQAPFFEGSPMVRDTKVSAAIQMIERNCSNPPAVAEIAARVNLSIRQLERRFGTALGMTPAALSRTIRLRFGHWLVLNSTRSLAQIAFDCGFSDQSHFTREFVRCFNVTPGCLREMENKALLRKMAMRFG